MLTLPTQQPTQQELAAPILTWQERLGDGPYRYADSECRAMAAEIAELRARNDAQQKEADKLRRELKASRTLSDNNYRELLDRTAWLEAANEKIAAQKKKIADQDAQLQAAYP